MPHARSWEIFVQGSLVRFLSCQLFLPVQLSLASMGSKSPRLNFEQGWNLSQHVWAKLIKYPNFKVKLWKNMEKLCISSLWLYACRMCFMVNLCTLQSLHCNSAKHERHLERAWNEVSQGSWPVLRYAADPSERTVFRKIWLMDMWLKNLRIAPEREIIWYTI